MRKGLLVSGKFFSYSVYGLKISQNIITDYLMAPSKEVFHAAVSQMKKILAATSNSDSNDANMNTFISDTCNTGNVYSHGSLLDVPSRHSNREKASHMLVYPFLYLIQHSVPDIRVLDHKGMPTSITSQAMMTVLSSIVWIVLSNYVLISSLDSLAGKFCMITGKDAEKFLMKYCSCL